MEIFANLQPLEREATAGVIAATIRQHIVEGTFAPGMQLGEVQLASRLGVSRGPVREAMQRLIQEGLLRNERHRGVFVITLDEDDIADIYLARNAIERMAAIRFVCGASREDVTRLEHLVEAMAGAARRRSWADIVDLDLEFHQVVVEATRSKRLIRMFQSLLAETRICLTQLESAYTTHEDAVAEHRSLLDALRSGDEERVLGLVDDHHEHAVVHLRLRRAAAHGDLGAAG